LPLQIEKWADALTVVESKRNSLVTAGKERARNFSIAASGQDLFDCYMAALS